MKTVVYLPDDEIIRQGDSGDKLYFISRGSVLVYIQSEGVNKKGSPLKESENLRGTQKVL